MLALLYKMYVHLSLRYLIVLYYINYIDIIPNQSNQIQYVPDLLSHT